MNETDINILCRLCLNKSYFYSNIYVGRSSDKSLFYEDINYVYDLQISVEDGLPEFICQKCQAMVKEFKLYKINALKAKAQLLHLKKKLDFVTNEDENKYAESRSNSFGHYHGKTGKKTETKIFIKEEPTHFDSCSFDEEMSVVYSENIVEPQVYIKEEEVEITEPNFVVDDIKEVGITKPDFAVDDSPSEGEPKTCMKQGYTIAACKKGDVGKGSINSFSVKNKSNPNHLVKGKQNCRSENSAEDGKFACGSCGKGFRHKNDLKKHEMTHTQERPNRCEECGKGFSSRYRLNRHRGMHTRMHQCGECGKVFQRKTEFNKHHKMHLREGKAASIPSEAKKFVCDKCGKGYNHKNDFKKHVMTHMEERPLHCEECGKGFISRYKLNRHRLVHSGEKPFECIACGMRFSRKDHFVNHGRVHSGEKPPFECKFCKIAYTEMGSLWTHMRAHAVL